MPDVMQFGPKGTDISNECNAITKFIQIYSDLTNDEILSHICLELALKARDVVIL